MSAQTRITQENLHRGSVTLILTMWITIYSTIVSSDVMKNLLWSSPCKAYCVHGNSDCSEGKLCARFILFFVRLHFWSTTEETQAYLVVITITAKYFWILFSYEDKIYLVNKVSPWNRIHLCHLETCSVHWPSSIFNLFSKPTKIEARF